MLGIYIVKSHVFDDINHNELTTDFDFKATITNYNLWTIAPANSICGNLYEINVQAVAYLEYRER